MNIGAAVNYWHAKPEFRDYPYHKALKKEINFATAESTCKMKQIAKTINDFDYSLCDGMVRYAENNGMEFRGHAALWAKSPFYPDFIRWETDKNKIENFMKNYITTTVGRYKGRVKAWDVVNEAIADKSPYAIRTDTPWAKVDDFICKSFKWAHAADPNAQLFYNDYGHSAMDGWYGGRGDSIFKMVKSLKDRGCPIHGVGFQLHENVDFEQHLGTISQNFQRYEAIGIKVHMTEIDV